MTRKNYRTGILLVYISLAFIAGLSACTPSPVGIFASIAQETDINASRTKAFDGSSPEFVGKLGDNYYTIINGTIWTKAVTGVTWGELATMPSGVSNGTASSATIAGTNLFVTFGLIGDSTQKVWVTTNGTTWNDALTTFPTTVKVDSLLSANGEAFAVTRQDTTVESVTTTLYSLFSWNGAGFIATGPVGSEINNISGRPTSVAHDGTDYWVTAGGAIYRGISADALVAVTTDLPSDTFAGVATEGTTVIFSSTSGKLYTFNDSGAWPVSGVFKKSDKPHAFSAPVIVSDDSKTYLLVGTVSGKDAATASGYLEFDITGGFTAATATASTGSDFANIVNYQTSVSTNYVRSISVAVLDEETREQRVFALTAGNGLWSNYFNGSSWSGWARE